MNRSDLQNLAEERLADAEVLLASQRFGAAFYVIGYAVECGLKACIAKQTKAEDFYDKNLAKNIFKHDSAELANYARLSSRIEQSGKDDPAFARNWALMSSWSEETRYESHTRAEAEEMIAAVQDPDHGVMQCIRRYW